MHDLPPRDPELRSPADLRTGRLAAATDILVGLVAGSALCMMLNHPPFGTRLANPSVWVLLPAAIGARHGEFAGLAAGLCAWGMHSALLTTGNLPSADGPAGAASAFLFMLAGGLAGFVSGTLRKIAAEELAKHASARSAIRRAHLTLRMAARVRDDLILELFRARSGGSAVAALLRRVLLAPEDRRRDEILEYLETVHEVKSAAVYRHDGRHAWRLVTSRGPHPDGAYPENLSRGLGMAATARFAEEPVFAENPQTETQLPLLVAPLVNGDSGVSEIVVVEDISAERLMPRETLGVATVIEFFGLSLHAPGDDDARRFADTADLLLRMRRGCGVESSAVVFADSEAGEAACAALLRRLPGALTGRWRAAGGAPALLAPGEHIRRLAPLLEETRAARPGCVAWAAGFHEAADDLISADEWVSRALCGDDWCI